MNKSFLRIAMTLAVGIAAVTAEPLLAEAQTADSQIAKPPQNFCLAKNPYSFVQKLADVTAALTAIRNPISHYGLSLMM